MPPAAGSTPAGHSAGVLSRCHRRTATSCRDGRAGTSGATRDVPPIPSTTSSSRRWMRWVSSTAAGDCCGNTTATSWARTAPRWLRCCCRSGPMAASPRWKASISSRRRPCRSTSSCSRNCRLRRRAPCAVCRTAHWISDSASRTCRCRECATTRRSVPRPRPPRTTRPTWSTLPPRDRGRSIASTAATWCRRCASSPPSPRACPTQDEPGPILRRSGSTIRRRGTCPSLPTVRRTGLGWRCWRRPTLTVPRPPR